MSMLRDWLQLDAGAGPEVAVELASRVVSAAAVETRGGSTVVAACAAEPLPAGALVPGAGAPNIRDAGVVGAALGRVLDRVGKPGRVGLVIPDATARVTHVVLQQPPSNAADLDQVLRWQVKKGVPFPLEEAQVSYVRGAASPQGQEFLVTVARRDVVEEYESLCLKAGAQPGIVDLSTTNVANAVMAGTRAPQRDWLLVRLASDVVSLIVLRGAHAAFYRSQSWEGGISLGDLVHQTAMYYEDRLAGTGFERILVSGVAASGLSADGDDVCRQIGDQIGRPVEVVDVREAVALADRITPSASLLDALAPLVGLLAAHRQTVTA